MTVGTSSKPLNKCWKRFDITKRRLSRSQSIFVWQSLILNPQGKLQVINQQTLEMVSLKDKSKLQAWFTLYLFQRLPTPMLRSLKRLKKRLIQTLTLLDTIPNTMYQCLQRNQYTISLPVLYFFNPATLLSIWRIISASVLSLKVWPRVCLPLQQAMPHLKGCSQLVGVSCLSNMSQQPQRYLKLKYFSRAEICYLQVFGVNFAPLNCQNWVSFCTLSYFLWVRNCLSVCVKKHLVQFQYFCLIVLVPFLLRGLSKGVDQEFQVILPASSANFTKSPTPLPWPQKLVWAEALMPPILA